jgi:glutaredoxin
MKPYYVLYTKKRCQYCRKAINLLNEKKQPYIVTDLTKNKEIMQEIKSVFKHDTVPIVLYVDKENTTLDLVGGYTELRGLFESQEQSVLVEDA